MWLVKVLGELDVYPVSFSKYGTIYRKEFADCHAGRIAGADLSGCIGKSFFVKGGVNNVYQYN